MSMVDDWESEAEQEVLDDIGSAIARARRFPWAWDVHFVEGLRKLVNDMNEALEERVPRNLPREATVAILAAIDEAGFSIHPYVEKEKECGFEMEDWTPNGVDMCHFIDLRSCNNPSSPFEIAWEIQSIADDFDPDEEVEAHMQDASFKSAFGYRGAIDEFEDWKTVLEDLGAKVTEVPEKFEAQGLTEDDCVTVFSISELLKDV